ncbi:MAG: carbohydrate ABC transporter permease [Spirochaetaceae bacterium]|nr:carbohydrate ABC transporter permease [Spirochaetaceae bacterium]
MSDALERKGFTVGKPISYVIFIGWALLTILPLFWMAYSSFKSNEELTRNIYAFPHDLFDNKDDEYVVITPSLNLIMPKDVKENTSDYLLLESTSIAPNRKLLTQFLPKSELSPDVANRTAGDLVYVNELPNNLQRKISRSTMGFNYTSAFVRGALTKKFLNSIVYTTVSTFSMVFLSLMIGYAVSKMRFPRLSAVVIGLIGLGYLISTNSVIIPLFLMLTRIGLTDTRIGMILVYTAFGIPMSTLLASQFIKGLPDSLIESAEMDGAGPFRAFLSIIVPMTVPVIITISIINALGIWNEFLLVLVLASSEATKSLPVGVYSFSSLTSTQLGWQLAALVIATAPAMIIYFSFNRRITQGVVAGAVKE